MTITLHNKELCDLYSYLAFYEITAGLSRIVVKRISYPILVEKPLGNTEKYVKGRS